MRAVWSTRGKRRRFATAPKTTVKAKPTPFYIHPAVKEILRDIAYQTRRKKHDLFVAGLEYVLKTHQYPTISQIIAKAEKS